MTSQALQFPRFYVTAPSPCPYLEGREERKVFTELRGEEASALNEALSKVGFRRSQNVAYRPACDRCSACISVRIVANAFEPTKRMRRTISRNADLISREYVPIVREEQFKLLKAYLSTRHAEGGMAEMDFFEYAEMVENTPVTTKLIEYRAPVHGEEGLNADGDGARGALVAVALTDVLNDGLSMVYSFFSTEEKRRSLGSYMILDHVNRARQRGLRNVYLGYWVKGSPKMDYKNDYQPLERLGPEGWSCADETE